MADLERRLARLEQQLGAGDCNCDGKEQKPGENWEAALMRVIRYYCPVHGQTTLEDIIWKSCENPGPDDPMRGAVR